ncbi:hypothetical protein [Candidatus Palauibacter sp.]|uniref:hypothetical protein n=1 Tax=Candidatus Palauibacter sp. TaxID=3101350 RepID=UPI003B59B00A
MSITTAYRRQVRPVMPSRFPPRHNPMTDRPDKIEAELRDLRRTIEEERDSRRDMEAALRMVVAALGALPEPWGDC